MHSIPTTQRPRQRAKAGPDTSTPHQTPSSPTNHHPKHQPNVVGYRVCSVAPTSNYEVTDYVAERLRRWPRKPFRETGRRFESCRSRLFFFWGVVAFCCCASLVLPVALHFVASLACLLPHPPNPTHNHQAQLLCQRHAPRLNVHQSQWLVSNIG
jgi:hypothetical protein